MKQVISKGIQALLKSIKSDAVRYAIMKPLFTLQGHALHGFRSLHNDRFFIYNVQGRYLPGDALHWYSSYPAFESWCDRTALQQYAVKPGDVVIDIGAGIGEEIIVLSQRVGDSGKVYAIEANTTVFEVLREVKKLNNLRNTEIFNLAVSAANEDVELLADDNLSIAGTIGDVKKAHANSRSYKVKGCRMDTFLEENRIQSVDLLKSNIEGAERFVVDSISKEQLRKVKRVAIACHDFRFRGEGNPFFQTKQHVSDFLIANGFEITSQQTGIEYIDDYVYGVNKHWQAAAA